MGLPASVGNLPAAPSRPPTHQRSGQFDPAIDYSIPMEHFRRPILSNTQRKVSHGFSQALRAFFVEMLLIIDLVSLSESLSSGIIK
jgi:hypothetical protein